MAASDRWSFLAPWIETLRHCANVELSHGWQSHYTDAPSLCPRFECLHVNVAEAATSHQFVDRKFSCVRHAAEIIARALQIDPQVRSLLNGIVRHSSLSMRQRHNVFKSNKSEWEVRNGDAQVCVRFAVQVYNRNGGETLAWFQDLFADDADELVNEAMARMHALHQRSCSIRSVPITIELWLNERTLDAETVDQVVSTMSSLSRTRSYPVVLDLVLSGTENSVTATLVHRLRRTQNVMLGRLTLDNVTSCRAFTAIVDTLTQANDRQQAPPIRAIELFRAPEQASIYALQRCIQNGTTELVVQHYRFTDNAIVDAKHIHTAFLRGSCVQRLGIHSHDTLRKSLVAPALEPFCSLAQNCGHVDRSCCLNFDAPGIDDVVHRLGDFDVSHTTSFVTLPGADEAFVFVVSPITGHVVYVPTQDVILQRGTRHGSDPDPPRSLSTLQSLSIYPHETADLERLRCLRWMLPSLVTLELAITSSRSQYVLPSLLFCLPPTLLHLTVTTRGDRFPLPALLLGYETGMIRTRSLDIGRVLARDLVRVVVALADRDAPITNALEELRLNDGIEFDDDDQEEEVDGVSLDEMWAAFDRMLSINNRLSFLHIDGINMKKQVVAKLQSVFSRYHGTTVASRRVSSRFTVAVVSVGRYLGLEMDRWVVANIFKYLHGDCVTRMLQVTTSV